MVPARQILWFLSGLLLTAVPPSSSWAQQGGAGPFDGVLVLRNGFVLQGRITPVQDLVVVTLESGGEVRMPRAEVYLECTTLEEAYLHLRDACDPESAEAHLKLAEWCLRHNLLARAADQILAAQVIDARNPRLRNLQQRLLGLAETKPAGKVVAKAVEPVAVSSPVVPTKIAPQVMQLFTSVVQPILLNRCALQGCHGNGGTATYRLIRPSTGQMVSSRMSQRNLQATLAQIETGEPGSSPLLETGTSLHGGLSRPPFTDKQRQQQELVANWVRMAALSLRGQPATPAGNPDRAANGNVRPPAKGPARGAEPEATPERPPAVVRASAAESIPEKAVDPFDAAVFNRRYHGASNEERASDIAAPATPPPAVTPQP